LRQLAEVVIGEALAGRGVRVADARQQIPMDKAGWMFAHLHIANAPSSLCRKEHCINNKEFLLYDN